MLEASGGQRSHGLRAVMESELADVLDGHGESGGPGVPATAKRSCRSLPYLFVLFEYEVKQTDKLSGQPPRSRSRSAGRASSARAVEVDGADRPHVHVHKVVGGRGQVSIQRGSQDGAGARHPWGRGPGSRGRRRQGPTGPACPPRMRRAAHAACRACGVPRMRRIEKGVPAHLLRSDLMRRPAGRPRRARSGALRAPSPAFASLPCIHSARHGQNA